MTMARKPFLSHGNLDREYLFIGVALPSLRSSHVTITVSKDFLLLTNTFYLPVRFMILNPRLEPRGDIRSYSDPRFGLTGKTCSPAVLVGLEVQEVKSPRGQIHIQACQLYLTAIALEQIAAEYIR